MVAGIALALAVLFVILIVRSLIVICPPNRVAVISGRKRSLSDVRKVGYRILKGCRTLRIPLIERVAWMDLNTIPLEVSVTNAYSKGAIPLNVQGIANVKVSSGEGLLENAAERFLHVDHMHIGKIAKETLEANLRGVLATMSPEEVNEDRLKFSHQLIDEADDDIKTLGLELDVLKIQNVTDDVNYLESVGRRLTAQVKKDARVAEADREAESEQAEAAARRAAQVAQIEADKKIVQEQNALRARTAALEAISRAREEAALHFHPRGGNDDRVHLDVGRLQAHHFAFEIEALERRLGPVHDRNHDLAIVGVTCLLEQDIVPVKDVVVDHRLPGHPQREDVVHSEQGCERQGLALRVLLQRRARRDRAHERSGQLIPPLVERVQLLPVGAHLVVVLRRDLQRAAAVEAALEVALLLHHLQVLVDRRDGRQVHVLSDFFEARAVVILGDKLRQEVQHLLLSFG